MADLLVIRSSPRVQDLGASSPDAHDDHVERTPPRDETKPNENRPSDPVSRTMKAVLSCSPGNPKNQWKMKIRALRWGTQVQHALAGEEILPSKCSSKPGSPVGKQAAGRLSPRVTRSKHWKQRKDVHTASNAQEAQEEAGAEVNSTLLGDKRQSTGIVPSCAGDDEPDNKADNCNNAKLLTDQSSPPADLLAETDRWTGEKRAKVVASPPLLDYYRQLVEPCDEEESWDVYDDPEQLSKVHERVALYRIRADKLFWEGKELDIAQLKEDYSSDTLREEGYFEHYEINREWYFDPEYCKRSALDDYQRLVLRRDVYDDYAFWESYHTTCTTLKCDLEFLQFYEELSSELKSVEDDDVEPTKEHFVAQCRRYDNKAHNEAPKIAARFGSINAELVYTGVRDCTTTAMFDLTYSKDLDRVFFEIWKRVANDKVDFKDALEDLYKLGLYPLQHRFIKAELEERPLRSIKIKEAYYTYVAHMDEKVSEDEVVVLIKEAVNKIIPKPLIYVDYIRKKLKVAKEIGVIP